MDATRHPRLAAPMRSADLRRLRARRLHAEPARPGASALLLARGTARRTPRAVGSSVVVPCTGLAARTRLAMQSAPPSRRETHARTV